jgi:alkylation response protein AidB-like acyl-CoA dehydrogenase
MDLNYTPEEIVNLEERRAWHRKLFEAGYLGMGWPKEYGVGVLALQCIVAETLAGLPR